MRVALAQTDCRLGDVAGDLATARERIGQAAAEHVDLVVFPELSLHGYHLGALRRNTELESLEVRDPRLLELSTVTDGGPAVLPGFHEQTGMRAYNTSAYYSGGRLVHAHRKLYLPTYLSWEERKHVSPGQALRAYDLPAEGRGRAATLICNDAWQPVLPWLAVQDGAEVVFIPASSAVSPGSDAMDITLYWDTLLSHTARLLQAGSSSSTGSATSRAPASGAAPASSTPTGR